MGTDGKQQEPAGSELFWTREEMRRLLGVGHDKLAALSRRRDSPLPCVRFGRALLYPKDRVRAWIDAHPTIADEVWGRA
jgi:hypothetical protein